MHVAQEMRQGVGAVCIKRGGRGQRGSVCGESRCELVDLEIPRSLAKKLRAEKPKGVGFKNFLLQALSAGTGGKPLIVAEPVQQRPVIGRNSQCSCGSGRKWKRCCGKKEVVNGHW
jgi:SEC-C motif